MEGFAYGFVFPDDLRPSDIILVANESKVETVLSAFQELGWSFGDRKNPLDSLGYLNNVRGISVWGDKILGWCSKGISDRDFSRLYNRAFNASDIIPSLRNLTFDSSLSDDDLPDVDLSEFLE